MAANPAGLAIVVTWFHELLTPCSHLNRQSRVAHTHVRTHKHERTQFAVRMRQVAWAAELKFKAPLLRQPSMIDRTWFNSRPRRVVASLDKTPCDVYLCLVELKQAANYLGKTSKHRLGNLELEKALRIRRKFSAAVAFPWQKDKHEKKKKVFKLWSKKNEWWVVFEWFSFCSLSYQPSDKQQTYSQISTKKLLLLVY